MADGAIPVEPPSGWYWMLFDHGSLCLYNTAGELVAQSKVDDATSIRSLSRRMRRDGIREDHHLAALTRAKEHLSQDVQP